MSSESYQSEQQLRAEIAELKRKLHERFVPNVFREVQCRCRKDAEVLSERKRALAEKQRDEYKEEWDRFRELYYIRRRAHNRAEERADAWREAYSALSEMEMLKPYPFPPPDDWDQVVCRVDKTRTRARKLEEGE